MIQTLPLLFVLVLQTPSPPPPPITPGAVVLLATAPVAEATPVLRSAIVSTDPLVRAVAARVVGASDNGGLAQTLMATLSTEQDAGAAAEQVRSLLLLRGAPVVTLESHAQRLGEPVQRVIREWRQRESGAAGSPHANSVRTPDPWVTQLLASTAAAADCKVSSSLKFAYARVTYVRDGRTSRIEIDPAGVSDQCQKLLGAIARITQAEPDRALPKEGTQWIMVPLTQSYLKCADGPHSVAAVRVDPASGITEPKNRKRVNPIYPLEMQQQRVQGMVIVEAVVTPTGCIGSARVLTSVHPVLDAAAVRAVLQWEFTPTLVGTTPVPVLMTVTVKFTLM